MGINILKMVLFPPPPSIIVAAMTVVCFVAMAKSGISEFRGKHLQYSKFFNRSVGPNNKDKKMMEIPSKVGMFVLYGPSALFGIASFVIYSHHGFRFLLLRLALSIHFIKRVLEVLFVHKFGGSGVALDASIIISFNYLLTTIMMIYSQHISLHLPEPSFDLKYIGVMLFLVGIGGNFYHHYILSTLRKEGEKEYRIPKGGLFTQVICPHYLFEVLVFVGVFCISQTLYSFAYACGVVLYLMGRSYATKKWYVSKFEDFPKNFKVMIPFVF